MTLFALILALILEQVRPLGAALRMLAPVAVLADGLSRRLNDGSIAHGRIAWLLLVGLSTFATAVAYWLLWELQPVFAFVFNIVVMYLCMGFRHDSHAFTEIHLALRMGELERAQTLLGAWRGGRYDEASASEIARLSIEMALVAAHRKLFGVVFWFVILPGPSGAVMYRVARLLAETWGTRRDAEFGAFGVPAQRAFQAIDCVTELTQGLRQLSTIRRNIRQIKNTAGTRPSRGLVRRTGFGAGTRGYRHFNNLGALHRMRRI